MSLNRFAKKQDRNAQAIINCLRMMGCSVEVIGGSEGCPDLLAGAFGIDQLVEVKPLVADKSKRELRASQVDWHARWRGRKPVVVRTLDDCEALVATLRGLMTRSEVAP